MAESARRSSRAARPGAEALEGRLLLSRAAVVVPPAPLDVQAERGGVAPKSGEASQTATRSPAEARSARRSAMAEAALGARGTAARPRAVAPGGRPVSSRPARMAGPPEFLTGRFDWSYVSPQSGEVNLTITRSHNPDVSPEKQLSSTIGSGPLQFRLSTVAYRTGMPPNPASIAPIQLPPVRTTGRDLSALPIVPIDGIYRFEPGQTSLTIPVRLNPNFVPRGEITLHVTTSQAASDPRYPTYKWGTYVIIVPSPDLVRPEIASSRLSPEAITVTFNRPMDPVTVEDLNNYRVTYNTHSTISIDMQQIPVTLESAVYDPATLTVTLTPTEPLTKAIYDLTLSPYDRPPGVRPPTDLQGNRLVDAFFSVEAERASLGGP